jgi:hypothetical protein
MLISAAFLVMAACRAPETVAPLPVPPESIEALPVAPSEPPQPEPSIPPPAYTESFASLHEGRLEALRLAHGLGDRMDPDTLLPYADTVDAGDAEPWRLTIPGYRMVLVRGEQGNVVVTSERAPFDFAFGSLPLRELDEFERAALARIEAGEDLVVEKSPGMQVRMLGAIRAEGQCRTCHKTTADGALMGAYSYHFKEMPDD